MKKQFFIAILLLVISFAPLGAKDYRALKMGIKLPYAYHFSYYARLSDRWGVYGGAQMITVPFSSAPLGYMKAWGADDKVVEILREPFTIGAGLDIGGHYYFGADNRRYYFALSLQWMNLLKRDIRDEVIEQAFGVDLDQYPEGPILKNKSTKPLTLNTNYLNAGLAFGVRFLLLNNPNWEMSLEMELSKTIFSHHALFSDYRYLTPVEQQTNTALKTTMLRYGYFPSLNVMFFYMLD